MQKNDKDQTSKQKTSLEIIFPGDTEFKGRVGAFIFDSAGNLREHAEVVKGEVSFPLSEKEIRRQRIYIAPLPENEGELEFSVQSMERLGAYSPVLDRTNRIRIPGDIIDRWHLCLCWVRGRVVTADGGLPVCGARVHICEVDKIWRWILRIPDPDIFRLRDDLIKELRKPIFPRPPRPFPDPPPFRLLQQGLIRLEEIAIKPQPEPPRELGLASRVQFSAAPQMETLALQTSEASSLTGELSAALNSSSAAVVRRALVENVKVLLPYLCFWPWWWKFRCDGIAVLQTDTSGRFHTVIPYLCSGDKPDLYFWVEYEIDGTWETVYRPPIACHTYWNYACGTEVTIRISDSRVSACDSEPDLPGCVVQILSVGRNISLSEIQGPGASAADEGLTTSDQPFGGKLEPRIWCSRTELRDVKKIKYYRWSYRRLTEGDGTLLAVPGPWTPLKRTVVRHYAKLSPGGVTHEPYPLGPQPVGSQANLFEIKPGPVPAGGIEWTVVDEREDLASAHFETTSMGDGDNACEKAFDAAGKYELKLELFKETGALVDWTAEGVDLEVTNVPAPFGTGTVTAATAPTYNRITDGSGHTWAFRMVLRVDNNCCSAELLPITGTGLNPTPCGFIEFQPVSVVWLRFRAVHPNDFANFDFDVVRGVTVHMDNASAAGRVDTTVVPTDDGSHAYTLTAGGYHQETFPVADLLGPCTRAAYSEALHVHTRATDGYGRLWTLDAFSHAGFALTPVP